MLSLLIGVSSLSFSIDKTKEKLLAKQFKTKLKSLAKDGWEISGTSRTLEVALYEHYEKLKMPDYTELSGEVSNCISINVCRQTALNNAILYYAQQASSFLKARVAGDQQINSTAVGSEFDKVYTAYERLVAAEIKGEIEESFSIVRKNGDVKEYKTFFLVNEKKAGEKRLRALENAFKETSVAQEYAKKISEFVKEGFETEAK